MNSPRPCRGLWMPGVSMKMICSLALVNALNPVARGLGFRADDRNLFSENRVHQGRFADIRRPTIATKPDLNSPIQISVEDIGRNSLTFMIFVSMQIREHDFDFRIDEFVHHLPASTAGRVTVGAANDQHPLNVLLSVSRNKQQRSADLSAQFDSPYEAFSILLPETIFRPQARARCRH